MNRSTAAQRGQWTREQKTAAEAVTTLLRAADGAGRSLESFFAGYGITGQQYNVLRILRGAGEPLPTMDVADRMIQKTPGLTGILDRLERKGLLTRARSIDDRRVWLCSLTGEADTLLADIEGPLGEANGRALAGVESELEWLVTLLAGASSGRSTGPGS